jgi:hypothetical protein
VAYFGLQALAGLGGPVSTNTANPSNPKVSPPWWVADHTATPTATPMSNAVVVFCEFIFFSSKANSSRVILE